MDKPHILRHWLIIFSWVLIACLCIFSLPRLGNPFKIGELSDPKAESVQGQKIIEKELPYNGSRVLVLFKNNELKAHHSTFMNQIKKSLAGLDQLPFENKVSNPYQNSKQISKNQHVVYALIKTNLTAEQLANYMDIIRNSLGNPANMTLLLGGEANYISEVNRLSERNLIRAEIIALPICFIVMIFVFGGITAAMITILSGVISIIIIITILYLLGHQIDLSIFVLNIATMLGLGLGLDYTLLLTYRFREEFAKSHHCNKAIKHTLSTSGVSILFSGLIVLISIASLVFFPINIIFSIGVAGIVVVIVTVLCTLTFLPAILCLLQNRVTKTLPQLKKIAIEDFHHHHRIYKFSLMVMKHPLLFLFPTILILLMLGYPFLNVKLNSSDAKILPKWTESRKVLDEFHKSFNDRELYPINVIVTAKNKSILSKANISKLYDYVQHLKKDPRIDEVISIVSLKSGLKKSQYQQMYSTNVLPFDNYQKQFFHETTKGKYTIISIISKYSKNDSRTYDLIKSLRNMEIGNGIENKVTGHSAQIIDTIEIIYSLFVNVIIVISIVTYFALLWLLRSIILPLKAILMNFLSLSVCYGMLVFIFQEGHFASLLHFTPLGFTDMNLPILLFFALFGLSMDYEVFLLTRIKEYYEKTGDNNISVAKGLERSARIITSAALILVIVTVAFVTADIVFIKAFGLGTALAIAVDASLIRLLLVPATMRLLGKWNWYLPKWLDKLLPVIKFDRE